MVSNRYLLITLLAVLAFSCRGPEGPTGPPGNSLNSLTDPSVMPSILTTYPLPNSVGPYTDFNSRIMIRFNKIMDRTSVKRAVRLSSPLGDVVIDTTSVSVQNTDVFTLAPLDSRGPLYHFIWKLGTVYALNVDTSAFDVNGNHLRSAYNVPFTPEPYFRVTAVSPANGSTEVALGSTITITFNSQVDSTVFSSIHITPALPGRWGFIAASPAPDSTQIRFTSQGANLDSVYTLEVDSTARDKHGDRVHDSYSSMFTTATFRVSSTSPANGSTSFAIFSPITMNFTAPLDTSTVGRAWSISPPVAGAFHFVSGLAGFTFIPNQRLLDNTTYTIVLSDSLASIGGGHLAQPYLFSCTTLPFEVSGTNPANASYNVASRSPLIIVFSDILDSSTIRSSVMISPSIPLSFILADSSTSFSCTPVNGYASNTTYTVMLTTGIRSKRGDSLGLGYSFSFTTAPFSVTGTNPPGNATGVALSVVPEIIFSAPVDTGSVRGAFSILPQADGDFQLYQNATYFYFSPHHPLTPNTTYTIALSTSLKSAEGSNLLSPYSFSFTTGGFQVTSTNFTGSLNVALTQPLNFLFNSAIDTGTVRTAFSVSPPEEGTFSMNSQGVGSFSFHPVAWASNTQYTVIVSTALQTTTGVHLPVQYQANFTTTQFRIVSVSPQDGAINAPTVGPIYIDFNGPIDTTGITTSLSIVPPVSGNIFTYEGSPNMEFQPQSPLRTNTKYTVSVGSIGSEGGGTPAPPYSFSFTTVPFQVASSVPVDGAVGISRSQTLSFDFNAQIDSGSVRNAFTISPAAAGNFYLYSPGSGFSFTPSSPLDSSTTYTVHLLTSMRSQVGDTLLVPYSMSFTTGN